MFNMDSIWILPCFAIDSQIFLSFFKTFNFGTDWLIFLSLILLSLILLSLMLLSLILLSPMLLSLMLLNLMLLSLMFLSLILLSLILLSLMLQNLIDKPIAMPDWSVFHYCTMVCNISICILMHIQYAFNVHWMNCYVLMVCLNDHSLPPSHIPILEMLSHLKSEW